MAGRQYLSRCSCLGLVHTHTQTGPVQALPRIRTASAVVGKQSGAATCGSDEEVGPRKPASQCQHPDCVKRATYGYEGQRAQYCKPHSLDGMEDVHHKRCVQPGCKLQATYSHTGQRPKFCKAHALEGMEDVKNKRCEHPGCKTQPSFSQPGQRTKFCQTHALEGMEDVRSKR